MIPYLYKYLRRKHLNRFRNDGEMRIGTLYDFRKEERYGSVVGDSDEGTKILTTDGYHFLDTNDSATIPDWFKSHFEKSIRIAPGGSLTIHARAGVRTRLTAPDRYVYCVSTEFDKGILLNGEYDCCIQIVDSERFFEEITIRLSRFAVWLEFSPCVYRSRLVLGDKDDGLDPALIKGKRYTYQREARAIWEAAVDGPLSPVIIRAKRARKCCVEIS